LEDLIIGKQTKVGKKKQTTIHPCIDIVLINKKSKQMHILLVSICSELDDENEDWIKYSEKKTLKINEEALGAMRGVGFDPEVQVLTFGSLANTPDATEKSYNNI
jgi:hypothetical protein